MDDLSAEYRELNEKVSDIKSDVSIIKNVLIGDKYNSENSIVSLMKKLIQTIKEIKKTFNIHLYMLRGAGILLLIIIYLFKNKFVTILEVIFNSQ